MKASQFRGASGMEQGAVYAKTLAFFADTLAGGAGRSGQ